MELSDQPPRLSASHWLLMLVLAAVQLTHILDFVLLMPLKTHLEDSLRIDTRQFGLVVSAYGLAACLSGLVLARWLDRFDRKPTLLCLYAGFVVGTLLCGLADSYAALLAARALAGACGGVVSAVVLASVGDAFPVARRGTAMGVVLSAFSIASIVGIPLGLLLANEYGWRAPFYVIAAGGLALLAFAWRVMPPLRGHLGSPHAAMTLWEVMSRPAHLRAFAFTLTVTMSSFVVIPFLPGFLETNVGRPRSDVAWMYAVGGVAALLTTNLAGRLSDRFPKLTLYRWMGLSVVIGFVWMTNLPPGAGRTAVLLATTVVFIVTSARMVPATALLTACAAPRNRGRFLSVNASVQQLGLALGPALGSWLMGHAEPGQPLAGYEIPGVVASLLAVLSVLLAGWLRPAPKDEPAAVPPAELAVAEA